MSEEIHELKEEEKAFDEENNDRWSSSAWLPGLILIGLGLIFLLNNVFDVELINNWWALFILIPAISNLNRAWNRYRQAGEWTDSARSALIGGLLIGTVAFIFLFNLSWSLFWPVLLIIIGAGILLRGA